MAQIAAPQGGRFVQVPAGLSVPQLKESLHPVFVLMLDDIQYTHMISHDLHGTIIVYISSPIRHLLLNN